MQGQGDNQPDADNRLDNQFDLVLAGALLAALNVILLQNVTYLFRQCFTIAKPT
ncbi:hypothetical protein D3C73_1422160 [compost metagenome]